MTAFTMRRVLVVLTAAALLAACGDLKQAVEAPSTTTSTARAATPLPVVKAVACIDFTGSVDGADRATALGALGDAVAAWPAAGRPALDLEVRAIADNSYTAGALLARADLAAVPPAPHRPTLDQHPADLDEAIAAWQPEQARADAELATARQTAAAEAAAIRGVGRPVANRSDIAGCFSAASDLFGPADGSRRFLVVVSDLKTDGPQQVGAVSLSGVDVLVVHTCGQAARCGALRQTWTSLLRDAGATTVQFARPELSASTIGQLFQQAAQR